MAEPAQLSCEQQGAVRVQKHACACVLQKPPTGPLLPDLADPAAGALLLAAAAAAEGVEDLLEAVGGAGQHDGAAAGRAELLLGHVEELPEGVAGEVGDGDEEPATVPGVGGEVALRARRRSRRGHLAAELLGDDLRQLQRARHDRNKLVELAACWVCTYKLVAALVLAGESLLGDYALLGVCGW